MRSSTSGAGTGEISGDLSEAIAGLEMIDEILDAGASVHYEWLAERLPWIDKYLRGGVYGQPKLLPPPIVAVGDRLQVAADDLLERLLARGA